MGMTFNDFQIGQELEPLLKPPVDKTQLVKYAGASGDYNLIHTDVETARAVNLPGIIVHGMLGMGFLGQLARKYAGLDGLVNRLEVRFSRMVFPGEPLTCTAKVVGKNEETKSVDLEIALLNGEGKPCTVGSATITLSK